MQDKKCDCVDSCHCLLPEKKCVPDNPLNTIRKLCSLLEDSMASELCDRHMLLIREYLEAADYAPMMQHVPYLTRCLELMTVRLQRTPRFRKVLIKLLELCKVRPMLLKTSECLTCVWDLTQYFDTFGYLLTLSENDDEIQSLLLNVLTSMLDGKREVKKSCVPLKTCYTCLEESQLPEIIVQFLLMASDEFYPSYLKITGILANFSNTICVKLAKAKALDYILLRMDPNWKTKNPNIPAVVVNGDLKVILHFQNTCKVFWRILKRLSNIDEVKRNEISPACLQSLQSLQYVHRVTAKDRSKRNDRNLIMILIVKYFAVFPNLAIIHCGLAEDIMYLSVIPEIKRRGIWAESVVFEIDEHDYYYKKMLLLMVCLLLSHKDPYIKFASEQMIKINMIIPGLLRLITPDVRGSWHPQLYRRLAVLGMHTLRLILPNLAGDLAGNNGILTLLTLIELFMSEEYEMYLFKSILRLLYFVNVPKNKRVHGEMLEMKAGDILLEVCNYFLSKAALTLMYQQCLALAFAILELIWKDVLSNGPKALEYCIKFLKRILSPNEEDTIINNATVTSFISFLWEILINDFETLKIFNKEHGVYMLLDLIQEFDFPIKMIGLGLLTDIAEEECTIPYILTWRNNNQNISNLLIETFKQENKRNGVRASERGVIEDIEYPLMGEMQRRELLKRDKEPDTELAHADMVGSCRPKVYALLELLNIRHLEMVKSINDHYKLQDDSALVTDEKIMLHVIENYLALKLGEAWVELDLDFKRIGIQPTATDFEVVQSIIRRYHFWTLNIKSKQEDELQEELNFNISKEKSVYRTLKDARLLDSLEAVYELAYIARTTDRQFLMQKQRKQTLAVLDQSIFPITIDNNSNFGITMHRTFMHNINVTNVFGQTLSLQGNVQLKRASSTTDILAHREAKCTSQPFKQ